MSVWGRFRGTVFAALLLGVALAGLLLAGRLGPADAPSPDEITEPIFRFEKEDLTSFRIERPDVTIAMALEEGRWRAVGQSWRPSASMVRRVAHQLHDLTARATVVEGGGDPALYGLGDGAIRVELGLVDGRTLRFVAGDPNPTSVSHYIQPLPGDRIYVVKKSALDYYRLDLESFREEKFAVFDARDADMLDATVDGRRIRVERTGELTWHMSHPVEQDASRDKVRMMLGRISALKAFAFVEDNPSDPARYGLAPPRHTVKVALSTGDTVTVDLGDPLPETDPPQRYAYRVEDDAVYAVRDGLLASYQLPVEDYRNRIILGKHEWDVTAMRVVLGSDAIALERTADGWRWPDGQAVPGSTPKRVAGRAADVRAEGFFDTPPPGAGVEFPDAEVHMTFDDGTARSVFVGAAFEVRVERPGEDGLEMRTETHRYVRTDGDPVIYEVDDELYRVVQDLHREYGRKVDREAERRIDLDAGVGAEP